MRGVGVVVVIGAALGAQLDLPCADRARSLQQMGRARLSELEQAEDVAWGTLREALARCVPRAADCEQARRAEFEASVARARTLIEKRHRHLLDEFEARCRLPLT
jgi:hypothetical protein